MSEDMLFGIVFAAITGFIILRVIRNGGIKGAIYGGHIEKEFDDVRLDTSGGSNRAIEVKILSVGSARRIGLGMKQKSRGNFNIDTVQLDKREAEELIKTLGEAIRHI